MADLVIPSAGVAYSTGTQILQAIAGLAINAGEVLYRDPTDSNLAKLSSALTLAKSFVSGIAVNSADPNQPVNYVQNGLVTLGAGIGVVGKYYVVSLNDGKIKPVNELAIGEFSTGLGWIVADGVLRLAINQSGVAVVA